MLTLARMWCARNPDSSPRILSRATVLICFIHLIALSLPVLSASSHKCLSVRGLRSSIWRRRGGSAGRSLAHTKSEDSFTLTSSNEAAGTGSPENSVSLPKAGAASAIAAATAAGVVTLTHVPGRMPSSLGVGAGTDILERLHINLITDPSTLVRCQGGGGGQPPLRSRSATPVQFRIQSNRSAVKYTAAPSLPITTGCPRVIASPAPENL